MDRRPYLAQFFSKPSKSSGGSSKQDRLQRAADMSRRAGLHGLLEQLDPLRVDAKGMQRQQQQRVVREQYFRDKRRMAVQERREREDLKRRMEQKRREIDNYYRVGELAQTDPRLTAASGKAQRKYDRYERKTQRRHHRQWLRSFRGRAIQRNKQYRQITKQMKKQARRSRGLPDEMQAPWNF